jgi:hypothetical protein
MKKNKLSLRTNLSGQVLVLVLIVVVILAGLWWYLDSTKNATQRDAIRYGHEVINRLVVNHERALLDQDLTPQAKLQYPPSRRDDMILHFTQWGVPSQPIQIEDNVTFDSHFFSPHGFFTAHLNYPAQPVTMQVAISQGATKWLIEDISISMQQMR